MASTGVEPEFSEPDWKLIAESIPHIVWVSDGDGVAEYLNRRGAEFSGLLANPDASQDWITVVHPDDAERALKAWDYAVLTGNPYDLDYRIRRADGVYRWHVFRALPVRDAAGEIVKWIGTATDVQEHKALELGMLDANAEAVESASLIAALEAVAPIGFVLLDLEQRVVRLNPEFAAINGAPRKQQIDLSIADLLPGLWPQLEPAYARVVETGATVRNACMIGGTADDMPRFHEWLVSCFPVHDGGVLAGVGMVTVDVTERAQAEEFRSAVMSQVADGVYTQDFDGLLTSMNAAACKMLGWTEEELQGQRIHDVIHFQNADGSPVHTEECSLLTSGTEGRLSRAVGEAFTRKDGSIFPIAYSSVPLRIGSRAEGIAVVFRDISEPGTSPNVIRLLVVDNHAMTTETFGLLLSKQEGIDVVGSAATSAAALAEVARLLPDVVLIDYGLPDLDGVATARLIKALLPGAGVILMNESYDEAVVAEAIAAGCAGVLDKDRAWVELVGAVRAAYHGGTTISQADLQRLLPRLGEGRVQSRMAYLTDREREVLVCLTEGLSNRAVSERLGVTPNTVRNHVQRILYKLNVHSRLEAVVVATNEPWTQPV